MSFRFVRPISSRTFFMARHSSSEPLAVARVVVRDAPRKPSIGFSSVGSNPLPADEVGVLVGLEVAQADDHVFRIEGRGDHGRRPRQLIDEELWACLVTRPSARSISARAAGSASVSKSTSAMGWTLMEVEMMNSSRASPTPSFGRATRAERLLRIADVHHDLRPRAREARSGPAARRRKSSTPVVDEARFALGARDGDVLAVVQHARSPRSVPTTAGRPSSRLTMAAWQVRPPRLVTIAAAIFIVGSQSGSVLSVTSTSPSRN